MNIKLIAVATCVAVATIPTIAQTPVTTTSGGASGSVPVFTSTTNVEKSVITQASNGNVGVGTGNPYGQLTVGAGNLALTFSTNDIPSGAWLRNDGNNLVLSTNLGDMWLGYSGNLKNIRLMGGGTTTQMILTSSGKVGIGTTSPSFLLDVNGELHTSNGVVFPDGTIQTTAYPASSGGSAPIQVVNNEAEFNSGVSSNGSGLKHVSSNATCQTYQYNGNYCTITITWPGTAFPDTNYDVVCTPRNGAAPSNSSTPSGIILYVPDASKTTTSVGVDIQVNNTTNAGGLITIGSGISCIAIHN